MLGGPCLVPSNRCKLNYPRYLHVYTNSPTHSYRNHKESNQPPQEFYRWPLVAEAGRNAINIRYQLLDYIYTAMHTQTTIGTPLINPMFFAYPSDPNTFPLQLQYFFGASILVAPVTAENATSVDIYLPDDQYYDWYTLQPIRGAGANIHLDDVPFTSIPLYIKGGAVLPLRISSANTTTELRKKNFKLVIAPDLDGAATGSLYLDDGVSIVQPRTSSIEFSYTSKSKSKSRSRSKPSQHGGNWHGGGDFDSNFSDNGIGLGTLSMQGDFSFEAGVVIEEIVLLGVGQGRAGQGSPPAQWCRGRTVMPLYNATVGTLTYRVDVPLTGAFEMDVGWGF